LLEEVGVVPDLLAVGEPGEAVQLALVVFGGGGIEVAGRNALIGGQELVERLDHLMLDKARKPAEVAVQVVVVAAAGVSRQRLLAGLAELHGVALDLDSAVRGTEAAEHRVPAILPDLLAGVDPEELHSSLGSIGRSTRRRACTHGRGRAAGGSA